MRKIRNNMFRDLLERLEGIDLGFISAQDNDVREAYLEDLEDIVNILNESGIDTREGDLAIQYFLTDPERAQLYLDGPTDIGDGMGLIEQVKRVVLDEETDYFVN